MEQIQCANKTAESGDALLDTGHPNEDHAGAALVKD
jgi:hypothetical protein